MKRLIAFLLFSLALSAQVKQLGPVKVAGASKSTFSTAASKTYTGQSCAGGTAGAQSVTPCGTALTLSTGDEVVVGGTYGNNTSTVSSISCASGTATISWSPQAGITLFDNTNGQGLVGGVGNVTGGGTCTPQITWNASTSSVGIAVVAFSGTANTVDGTPASHQNTGSASANANTSGSVTTASNGDILAGLLTDTSGSAATVTAGTTSVTFTKILCDATSGANLCIEWGTQTSASAGTQANWTLSNTDRTVAGLIAIH